LRARSLKPLFFLYCTGIICLICLGDSLVGQSQGPEWVKVISVPATQIATEHGAIQVANTTMFVALMQAGNLGLPKVAYG